MTNNQIADCFDQIADLLEFQGANPFRVRAYRSGSRTIRDLPEEIAVIVRDESRKLTDIPGIGKDLAEKCVTLVQTGRVPMLDELLSEIPESVLALLRIPGLGPKKAAVLYRELGVTTLEEVAEACRAGKVRELKGFAAKTEQLILSGLKIAAAADERIYWAAADEIAQKILSHLTGCEGIEKIAMAGSYRRGKETVGDLDVLVVSENADLVMDRFGAFPGTSDVIARGPTKMSIRSEGVQIDLRVVQKESFGAALQYFTGSKDHNVELRGRAKQRGLKINEYGLYRVEGDHQEYVAGETEEEIYAALDLPLFPPELREARQEYKWAEDDSLPKLIEQDHIRGDLHMHTHATDGKASIEEMVEAAKKLGYKYIAITDHSQRVSMAQGLNAKRLLSQWEEIDRINKELGKSFTLLKGIECDILEKGGMDLHDEVLSQADWVVASIHYGQKQPREQITARILGALENPYVHAIAHPTGRIINRRNPYEVDMETVCLAAKKHGKLLELNANPARLDLNDIHCAAAKRHGIPIVINSDAHSIEGLKVMRYGILQARRAGLEKADVANTRTWPQLKKMIGFGASSS